MSSLSHVTTLGTDLPDRRDFVGKSGSALSGFWILRLGPLLSLAQACARDTPLADEESVLTTLSEEEASDLDALASRILPTDETPGAREMGAVRFADRALGTLLSDALPEVRDGFQRLRARVAARFGEGATYTGLPAADQDDLLDTLEGEDPDFFFVVRTLVLLALSSDPAYGGNEDGTGWNLLGFEDRFVYQPPFGYYDRDEHGAGEAGP